jgi:tetratricopeptide (TPR) repeat protein/transcriptional regulator with XRE-family HTH domain
VRNDLGDALREARRASGIKWEVFALRAGYSVSHLRSVENGLRSVTSDVAAAYDRVLRTGGAFYASSVAAIDDAHSALSDRWDQDGTLAVLGVLLDRGDMDRRAFVAASASTLPALASTWRSALGKRTALPPAGSRQISPSLVGHIDQRLDHLRHLDDELGSGDLAALARNELALIAQLLRAGRYTEQTGLHLYRLAAEASRQVAWDHFDQHHHATAQRFFELALRASATADDAVSGAYALSFMAVQCYSIGQGRQAVSLLETALAATRGVGTPRMTAMLAARSARALSKVGDRAACVRMLDQARDALDRGAHPDDPPTLYWVTEGEIEMIAGSCALDLGDPAEAIRRFDAAIGADYRGDEQYPRSHAIYLARAAEAHLALRDVDAAVSQAIHATRCLGGVDSARSTSTLAGLRAKLADHRDARVVRDFLEATG